MKKGERMTEEHKMKISQAQKALGDRHWTKRVEVRAKISESNKGRTGYWAGKKRDDPLYLLKISEAHRGQHSSLATEFKKGQSFPCKGKKIPSRSGENHYAWKGGVTPINEKLRKSIEYKQWRESVFRRDDYICQACGKHGGNLHAHHNLAFSSYPDLRFEVLNGVTLCVPCHRRTESYGRMSTNLVHPAQYRNGLVVGSRYCAGLMSNKP